MAVDSQRHVAQLLATWLDTQTVYGGVAGQFLARRIAYTGSLRGLVEANRDLLEWVGSNAVRKRQAPSPRVPAAPGVSSVRRSPASIKLARELADWMQDTDIHASKIGAKLVGRWTHGLKRLVDLHPDYLVWVPPNSVRAAHPSRSVPTGAAVGAPVPMTTAAHAAPAAVVRPSEPVADTKGEEDEDDEQEAAAAAVEAEETAASSFEVFVDGEWQPLRHSSSSSSMEALYDQCVEQTAADGIPASAFVTEKMEHDLDKIAEILGTDLAEQFTKACLDTTDRAVQLELYVGRKPHVRFTKADGNGNYIDELSLSPSTQEELDNVHAAIDAAVPFDDRNRSGISHTLHRVSRMVDRSGAVLRGLTLRIGRFVPAAFRIIQDLLDEGQSLLFIGPPGVGKTTLIRSCVQYLADHAKKSVVIVDSTNEIAGATVPLHHAVGNARRMEVSTRDQLFNVMLEAVENHSPDVVVIDEIGSRNEALAAQSIAQRGVRLIASAHGHDLSDVLRNRAVNLLVGGAMSVTHGDQSEYAAQHGAKVGSNRQAPAVFPVAVEMRTAGNLFVHRNVEDAVDELMRNPKSANLVLEHRARVLKASDDSSGASFIVRASETVAVRF